MKLIPMPKSVTLQDGVCDFSKVCIASLPAEMTASLQNQIKAVVCGEKTDDAIPLTVCCGNNDVTESYRLSIAADQVNVTAAGERGVFYALQTLRQLLSDGQTVACVTIDDAPDLAYRGFYHDVSRGRIPTLDTLKTLVDRMSSFKMNSLQLYVEHTHRFAQYAGIQEDLGYYTDKDILELDRYCRERCVELIPSLSSFGHLYYLLQSPPYRHLCEIEGYEPTRHVWHERLMHHTIDPSNPESLQLITSLIGQYASLFSSKYFNICCDETFDLCKGRNAGGNVAKAYIGFVSQLAAFLRERGKTVMMWGDIVMQHRQVLEALPDDIVYLNWCYDMSANGLRAEYLKDRSRCQIVCPSVHSHKRFVEKIEYSIPNIERVIECGFENGAAGVLTTNWGDYGHMCFDEGMLYGMAFGAAKAWNVGGTTTQEFESAASSLIYRADGEVIGIIRELNRCDELFLESFGYEKALWELTVQYFDNEHGIPLDYDRHKADLRLLDLNEKRASCLDCASRLQAMLHGELIDKRIGQVLLLAARGMAVVFGVLDAVCHDRSYPTELIDELNDWLDDYKVLWMERNQKGEWQLIETFFRQNIYR